MIGAYTIGKKAVTFGYKRYGIPGAVASGGLALAGYVVVRRALKSATNGDESDSVASAIDAQGVKNAVDERGLAAVTERGTLEDVVDQEALDAPVDMDEVQSSATEESDEVTGPRDEAGDGE